MIYFRIQRVHRCDRCEMQYPWRFPECPHCSGLTDDELVLFKKRREQELEDIAGLGRVFIVLTVLMLIFTIVVAAG